MAEEKTQTSRILYSIKNHKICSIVIVVCTIIIAVSAFLKSTYEFVETTEKIKEKVFTKPNPSAENNTEPEQQMKKFNLEDFKTGSTGTTKEEAIIITQQPIVFEWRSGEVTFSLYRVGDKTMFHELKKRSPFTLKYLDSDLYKLRFNSDGEHFDVFFRVEISP